MLFLLSPAKTLDFESPVPPALRRKATDPPFTAQAAELIEILRRWSPADVATRMSLSDQLATLNVARWAAWQPVATARNSKPAVLAFAGDVYQGLQAATLDTRQLSWAQDHLVILSGLYGALRPLDRLQPYRLEMGTALANPRGKDLLAFWGDTVADYLNERLAQDATPQVVNLASVEYSRVALRPALRAPVVDCVFEETGPDGRHRVISFYAKKARGLMARWAVVNRAQRVRHLQGFDLEGYGFVPEASSPQRLVFRRPQPVSAASLAADATLD